MAEQREEQKLRLNNRFGVGGLLVGLAVLAVVVWGGQGLRKKDAEILAKITQGSNPNDSPVTVRGGSLVVVSPDSWTCTTDWKTSCDATLSTTTAVLEYIDGVDSATMPPHRIDFPITTNWAITLTYRDDSGKKASCTNPPKTLQICTTAGCSSDTSAAGSLLHLKGDGMGVFSTDESCGTDAATGKNALCNHIYNITVQSSSGTQTYHCADGACSIGIGAPPAVPAK